MVKLVVGSNSCFKRHVSMQKSYTKFAGKMWNAKIYKKNVKASGYKHHVFAILVEIIQ